MLDTWVQTTDLGVVSAPYQYVLDKFNLLYRFLALLRRQEEREFTRFAESWGVPKYRELFGDWLIVVDMLSKIYPNIKRLLSSQAREYRNYESEYRLLLRDYAALMIYGAQQNQELLGIAVDTRLVTADDLKT
jgi:hypothetical protein